MTPVLDFDLERRYPGGPIIRATLRLPAAEAPVTVLFGPSGSGKTTVLRCLAGLDRPDAGAIRFGEETWFDASRGTFVPPQRRAAGFLAQDHALFPHLTVERNVAYGLGALGAAARAERVREVSRLLRIEDLGGRRPAQLSGGQRQRVALARALAPRPRLLLLDEPLSALDLPTRDDLRRELRHVLQRAGAPSIVVTHDRVEALALGDRIAVLAEGRVRQMGPVPEVFSAPADVVVARVVGTENVSPARVLSRDAGLATVSVGSARLTAVDPGDVAGEAYACIRAEEVLLEEAPGAPTSARNQLPARVVSLAPEGPMVRVALDCGFPLVALVTRRSADELRLAPGREVAALVKAPAVRLVARDR